MTPLDQCQASFPHAIFDITAKLLGLSLQAKPHAKKTKLRKVSLWKASKKMSVYFELKANPMRPGSKHHDEPILLPFNSSRNCVICKNPTRRHCWGCNEALGEIFPVCTVSVRPNCNAEMHRIRRNMWVYHELSKQFTKQNMYWYNQNFVRITIWLLYINLYSSSSWIRGSATHKFIHRAPSRARSYCTRMWYEYALLWGKMFEIWSWVRIIVFTPAFSFSKKTWFFGEFFWPWSVYLRE